MIPYNLSFFFGYMRGKTKKGEQKQKLSIPFTKSTFQNKIPIFLHVIFDNLRHIRIMVISMCSHSHQLDHMKGIRETNDFFKTSLPTQFDAN